MQVKKIIVCILIIFSSFAHGSNDQLIKNEQALIDFFLALKKVILKVIKMEN